MGTVALVAAGIAIWALRPSASNDSTGTQAESAASVAQSSTTLATEAADDRKMMVVLPFENLGPPEESYFAAGMTEEITSRLAAVSGLGVISRTSATQYDRTGKTIGQIADDLGVDFVVEGTVRWAKNADGTGRVRITPQLIRVSDDTHLWSETYDRQMDDIFEVQTEIASHVIDQLGVTLLGTERETLAKAPTENMEAYQLYLQAQDLKTASWDEYDRRAVALLEEAVKLDPGFLQAWSMLSQHHSGWYNNGLDKTEARLAKARAAMQQAEAIDPDHPQTHITRGVYHYFGFRDYDQALEEFLAANRLVPNDVQAMEMISYIFRRQGKLEEHLDRLEAAFVLDPQNDNIARNLGMTYRAQRRFAEAVAMYDRAIVLNPDNFEHRFRKAMIMLSWNGDLAAAREILQEKPVQNAAWHYFGWMVVHSWSREWSEAVAQARLVDDGTPFMHAMSTHIISSIEARFGISDPDSPTLEEAGRQIEALLEMMPSHDGMRAILAENLALRGQNEAAVREAKLAVDLAAKDAFSGTQRLLDLAKVYAWIGRQDEAIDLLARLLKTVYEGSVTPEMLKNSPEWDPLRENPRFKELLAADNI